mmetsp:Transcript_20041/g.51031  ORF Transcript_20041/g.51031 Transcript_20041/m.51031 type:complete len:265 (-) Transcript_20041:820-1614(-)
MFSRVAASPAPERAASAVCVSMAEMAVKRSSRALLRVATAPPSAPPPSLPSALAIPSTTARMRSTDSPTWGVGVPGVPAVACSPPTATRAARSLSCLRPARACSESRRSSNARIRADTRCRSALRPAYPSDSGRISAFGGGATAGAKGTSDSDTGGGGDTEAESFSAAPNLLGRADGGASPACFESGWLEGAPFFKTGSCSRSPMGISNLPLGGLGGGGTIFLRRALSGPGDGAATFCASFSFGAWLSCGASAALSPRSRRVNE